MRMEGVIVYINVLPQHLLAITEESHDIFSPGVAHTKGHYSLAGDVNSTPWS
jgi:hypothetical protein